MPASGRLAAAFWLPVVLIWAAPAVAQRAPKSSPEIDSLVFRTRSDSNDAPLRYRLALAYWKVDRLDDADHELRQALTVAPQYPEAFLARAALGSRAAALRWGAEAGEEFLVRNDDDIRVALEALPDISRLLGGPTVR